MFQLLVFLFIFAFPVTASIIGYWSTRALPPKLHNAIHVSNRKKFIPALGHDWLTNFYDLTIKLTMPEVTFRAKLIDQLEPNDGESISEFGFGTGQNLILAYQRNEKSKVIGFDIDRKSQRYC